jgi:hypothetical protein
MIANPRWIIARGADATPPADPRRRAKVAVEGSR